MPQASVRPACCSRRRWTIDNHVIAIFALYLPGHRHPSASARSRLKEWLMPDLYQIKQEEQGVRDRRAGSRRARRPVIPLFFTQVSSNFSGLVLISFASRVKRPDQSRDLDDCYSVMAKSYRNLPTARAAAAWTPVFRRGDEKRWRDYFASSKEAAKAAVSKDARRRSRPGISLPSLFALPPYSAIRRLSPRCRTSGSSCRR